MLWFSDGKGNPTTPPENVEVVPGTANAGIVSEIENPNPQPGTNNWYTEDGYGGGSFGSASFGGGSYTNCADTTQPGVQPIVGYLRSLPHPIDPHGEPNHYYLLNNYNPGYFGNGNNAFTDTNAANTVFTIPPSSVPSIGDTMLAAGVSWKYYGDQWDNYVPDPYQLNYGYRSSSQAAWSTAIRVRPSWTCSKASLRRSSMPGIAIRNCGGTPPSSSPSMRAAAITTPVTCNHWITLVTAPVSH